MVIIKKYKIKDKIIRSKQFINKRIIVLMNEIKNSTIIIKKNFYVLINLYAYSSHNPPSYSYSLSNYKLLAYFQSSI